MNPQESAVLSGYATDEWDSEHLYPYNCYLAHRITELMSELRRSGSLPWILPDCNVLLALEYTINKQQNNKLMPKRVSHIVIETQHTSTVT